MGDSTDLRVYDVLFLCTGNSARSLMAERMIEDLSAGRVRGHSAGSRPTGRPHPMALQLLRERGHDTAACRSKSWDEFAGADAARLDFVLTLCDSAKGESCPLWPGHPARAHWGIEDPAACEGDEAAMRRAFVAAYEALRRRIERLLALPFDALDEPELTARLQAIGRIDER